MKTNSTPNRQNGEPSDRVNDSSSAEKQPSASTSISGMRVQWSDQSKQVTQMAGLAYFVQFLETTGLFDHFVESCPLAYQSNNAPHKRAVLGTILLSVLSGPARKQLKQSFQAQIGRLEPLIFESQLRRCALIGEATENGKL